MSRIIQIFVFSLLWLQLFFSMPAFSCEYDPGVAQMLEEISASRWNGWIRILSGTDPVSTSAGMGKILTRSSLVMFEPNKSPNAFDYLQETLVNLGYKKGQDFEIHTYDFPYGSRYPERNWKNIILTIPGIDPQLKDERVLLVAHMDSTSDQEYLLAPGADDNASGTAGLLEAAAVLRAYHFGRTINLIWFSGEEKSRIGSLSFVEDYSDWLPDIVGVINLDMFAYDRDNDRCFEVHSGSLPCSKAIGDCIGSVINAYDLDLIYDFIDDESAYIFSDHYPFWKNAVPGVMIFENSFYQPGETCGKTDRNYAYHTTADTAEKLNISTGSSILQAGIATAAHLAQPLGVCFSRSLEVKSSLSGKQLTLNWQRIENEILYRVWVKENNFWTLLGETTANRYVIPENHSSKLNIYRVSAVSSTGCHTIPTEVYPMDYFPLEKFPR